MSEMQDTTLIALLLIGGVFLVTIITVIKHQDVDSAIKMWSVMGVAVGGVCGYYFGDNQNKQQLVSLQATVSSQEELITSLKDSKKEKRFAPFNFGEIITEYKPQLSAEECRELIEKDSSRAAVVELPIECLVAFQMMVKAEELNQEKDPQG